ncbi:hypothetical protein Pyn_05768 [Prunus yedoensis var. nudiflora]|uniref:Uncharacterized protein n=1 Tax=Prunus yedoensis var. nudiflora TaxID=2094558 RepID=A0A314ZMK5_PRUYE|nr:hypothetical protein Pyn_05768 [Prunus yedoensis var. nudiflora]
MFSRKIHATNNQMPDTIFRMLLIPTWCHILVIPLSRRGGGHLHSIKMETLTIDWLLGNPERKPT